jgi:hypothetical protein
MRARGDSLLKKAGGAIGTALILFLWASSLHSAGIHPEAAQASGKDSEDREHCRHGVELMMDGDTDAAIKVFRETQQSDPQSPLGYLLEAQSVWWQIYYASANLLDTDVFDVARQQSTPLDSHFSDLLQVAITRAEVRIGAQQDVARNYLYEGMAYALDARLSGMRGRDLATVRAGKKMRTLLMTALKMDSNLADANLGLGNYNYFIDTLPPAIKFLRVIGNVPAGNRDVGLQQLHLAAEHGDLVQGEAKFYLAKTYSSDDEKKFKNSLELFQDLGRDYPHNPLWKLMTGEMRIRLGETAEGDALYRRVAEETKGMKNDLERSVHRAARDGYIRRHPGEKTME